MDAIDNTQHRYLVTSYFKEEESMTTDLTPSSAEKQALQSAHGRMQIGEMLLKTCATVGFHSSIH